MTIYFSQPGRIDPGCEKYHRCRKGDRVVDQLERRGVGNAFVDHLRADIVVAQNGAKGLDLTLLVYTGHGVPKKGRTEESDHHSLLSLPFGTKAWEPGP